MSEAVNQNVSIPDTILRENISALQLLPPGNSVPHLRGQLAHQLLIDLAHGLGDNDPMHWLEHLRSHETAILALALTLGYADRAYGNMREVANINGMPVFEMETAIRTKYESLHGELVTSKVSEQSPVSWIEKVDSTKDIDKLTNRLALFRRQSGITSIPSPKSSLTDPAIDTLLADLLRLPDSVDPVQWLKEQRLPLSTKIVLEYFMQVIFPSKHLSEFVANRTHVQPPLSPNVSLRVRYVLTVCVVQVDFYEDSFLIHLNVKYRLPRKYPQIKRGSFIRWDGFQQITDDNGYRYLVRRGDLDVSKRLWWWQERLTLICWPALGNARELILQASPTALSMYRPPSVGNSLVSIPTPRLDNLHCSIALKDRRT
jgi:hypothetical protein